MTLFSLHSNLRREELLCAQVTIVAQEGNYCPKAAELCTAGTRAAGLCSLSQAAAMAETQRAKAERDKMTQKETHGRDTKTQNGNLKRTHASPPPASGRMQNP